MFNCDLINKGIKQENHFVIKPKLSMSMRGLNSSRLKLALIIVAMASYLCLALYIFFFFLFWFVWHFFSLELTNFNRHLYVVCSKCVMCMSQIRTGNTKFSVLLFVRELFRCIFGLVFVIFIFIISIFVSESFSLFAASC